jgi:hypothetical protein
VLDTNVVLDLLLFPQTRMRRASDGADGRHGALDRHLGDA